MKVVVVGRQEMHLYNNFSYRQEMYPYNEVGGHRGNELTSVVGRQKMHIHNKCGVKSNLCIRCLITCMKVVK